MAKTVESGKLCPNSGIWKVMGKLTTTVPIASGTLMPEYCEKKVRWILLYSC